MIIDTISAEDTAMLLGQALGPLRARHDFLADCIRGKTSLFGMTYRATLNQLCMYAMPYPTLSALPFAKHWPAKAAVRAAIPAGGNSGSAQ